MSQVASEYDSRIGSLIAGKYRVVRLLGVGGMGSVYEARNEWTERRVALKLLHAGMAGDSEATARFLREARASTRIGHPNIVEVLDMGQDPSNGALYIVQEFLVGVDLRTLLEQRKRLPPREALECLMPVMAALVSAHRVGIVHRDLKPENIFLTKNADGVRLPKLIDFGIAKIEGHEGLGLTRTGATMGTPYYMSPEQAGGERVIDGQTDVWAIGVVLFESLAGRVPYDGENYNQLIAKILTAPEPRLSLVAPDVPPRLARAVDGAVRRNKASRYRSMAFFLDALIDAAAFAGGEWQRSTRRWFERQVGAFDEDDEGQTSLLELEMKRPSSALADELTSTMVVSDTGKTAPVTPRTSSGAQEISVATRKGAPDFDVASRWEIAAPPATLLDDEEEETRPVVRSRPEAEPSAPALPASVSAAISSLASGPLAGVPPSTLFQSARQNSAPVAPATAITTDRRRSIVILPVVVGLLACAGGAAMIVYAVARNAAQPVIHIEATGPTSRPSTSPPMNPVIAASAHAAYRVQLNVEVPDAVLTVDGVPTNAAVLDRIFAVDGRTHIVLAEAPGHAARTVTFRDSPPPETSIELAPLVAIPASVPTRLPAAGAVFHSTVERDARPSVPPARVTSAPRANRQPVRVVRDYDEE